jgi:fatty acid amide hydrolase
MNQKLTNSILITFWRYLLLDQGKLLNVLIDKENFDVYYTSYFLKLHKKNKYTISIQKYLLDLLGQKRMTLQFVSELKGSDVAEESINIFKFREIFLKKLNELELDAVICPVMPFPAPDIIDDKNEMLLGSAALSYTILFNFMNMPCGVVPITLVKENELAYRDIKYRDWIRAYIAKTIKNSLNMPVGIQVASFHNRDEVVLRIMNEIQSNSSFPYKNILEVFK